MENAVEDTRALLPSRKSSLNARLSIAQEHRKRKSSTIDELSVLTSSFEAVTLENHARQTFTFHPISTILRAHLPLSWLSGTSICGPLPATVLRATITSVNKWDYHVLIVRLASNRALFALERVENDVYISYPLHNWVRPQWIEQAAYGAAPVIDLDFLLQPQPELSQSRKPSTTNVSGTVEHCSVPPSPKLPTNRRGHLARLSIFEAREKAGQASNDDSREFVEQGSIAQDNPDQSKDALTLSPIPIHQSDLIAPMLPVTVQSSQGSAVCNDTNEGSGCVLDDAVQQVDHLSPEHLRRQFLETLYLTKTSLAFYAKGPLSRARARARIPGASQTSQSLADFYRESILPPKKTDLKYKETIQAKIASLVYDQTETIQTSRKMKRTKLGKDGLWPVEHEYIEKWWRSQDLVAVSLSNPEGLAAQTKNLIFQLRMRETEMHILLILEILALQAKDIPNQQTSQPPTAAEVKVESIEGPEHGEVPKVSKSKKKPDLRSELDLLVDRLCIWHSIGLETAGIMLNEAETSGSSSDKIKDRLRDFCKDVLIPFYGGKLTEVCQDLSIKMGGPEVTSRRTNITSEKTSRRMPGSAITTERGLPNKRNLQRVLSEEQSTRHASPPSLLRSATISMPVKREPSERPISRSGLQKSVSFSNREVDLVADARATAAKRRKLDLVTAQKRELDAAIETLKRPNRHVVAKSFMDDAERRTLEDRASAARTEPIQISATPRKSRTRPAQDDEYDLPSMPSQSFVQEQVTIPSSTAKPRGLSQLSYVCQSSAKKRAVLSAIHDTPSRASTSKSRASLSTHHTGLDGAVDGESSSTLVASTPTTSRLRIDLGDKVNVTPMRMCKSLRPVLFTPMQRSEINIDKVFKDVPEIPERAGKVMDRAMGSKADAADVSLYESLGWDDDYDL